MMPASPLAAVGRWEEEHSRAGEQRKPGAAVKRRSATVGKVNAGFFGGNTSAESVSVSEMY